MKKTLLLLTFVLSVFVHGQEKKKLDHTIYDSWNSITELDQSPSGQTIVYTTEPYEGDGVLSISFDHGINQKKIARAHTPSIHFSDEYVAFFITPQFDTIRALKLDGLKENELPKDSLGIYLKEKDTLLRYSNIQTYEVAEKGDWIVFHSSEDLRPEPQVKKCLFKKRKTVELSETSGKTLFLMNPITNTTLTYHNVTDYYLNESSTRLFLIKSEKSNGTDSLYFHKIDIPSGNDERLSGGYLNIKKLTYHEKTNCLIFFSSLDTNEQKNMSLEYWQPGMFKSEILIDSSMAGLPESHNISAYNTPQFSKDGTKLFIGTQAILHPEPEDTLLEEEKVYLDIWGGDDAHIQPQQLLNSWEDAHHTQAAIYHFANNKIVSIDTTLRNVNHYWQSDAGLSIGLDNSSYQKEITWEYPWKQDIYLIDQSTGETSLLLRGHGYSYSLSPSGNYFVWYAADDSSWYSKDIRTGRKNLLFSSQKDLLASDQNGYPFLAFSEGAEGWTKINEEEHFVLNTTYDVWAVNPSKPDQAICLSKEKGRADKVIYRYEPTDYDSLYTDVMLGYLHGIDQQTKAESYHSITIGNTDAFAMNPLITSDHRFIQFERAEKANQLLVRRMSVTDYPEIEIIKGMDFSNPEKISSTNPQQEQYNWSTVDLIHWISYKGDSLDGLLYFPEDYDSTKNYPMIIYYYEKNAQNLHNHFVPRPTASIIYPTEYASNGYVIFIPDILYESGHPAQSAYDCIMSGTDYVLKNFPAVDSTRMGLQGQSWGGYQTAQLITMTKRYAAAMAGAPVSNMFSAYGGVRWGSGNSRMFQYERGQSRIGKTIWESPELYIENSPIFGLPEVRTPLLIMHNDNDGAVPWYQGIELYMGLRRLNQPVWMLNYNGDQHNLMQTSNRRDLSRRMHQFFDHYLLDTGIPLWMDEGIPATEKGKKMGFELKN